MSRVGVVHYVLGFLFKTLSTIFFCSVEVMERHAFLGPLLYDMFLVLVFVAQHSIMATDWWKSIMDDFGLRPLTRSLYCIATSTALQVCH